MTETNVAQNKAKDDGVGAGRYSAIIEGTAIKGSRRPARVYTGRTGE